jgi:hypothetical protein
MSGGIVNNIYDLNYVINPSDYFIINPKKQINNKNELSIEIL